MILESWQTIPAAGLCGVPEGAVGIVSHTDPGQ